MLQFEDVNLPIKEKVEEVEWHKPQVVDVGLDYDLAEGNASKEGPIQREKEKRKPANLFEEPYEVLASAGEEKPLIVPFTEVPKYSEENKQAEINANEIEEVPKDLEMDDMKLLMQSIPSPSANKKEDQPSPAHETPTSQGKDKKQYDSAAKPMNYRTVPCRLYHGGGGCSRGEFCHFIHVQEYEGKEAAPTEIWKNKRKRHEDSPRYSIYSPSMMPFPMMSYMYPGGSMGQPGMGIPGFPPKGFLPFPHSPEHSSHRRRNSKH
eukprot:TRINITY_DN7783_c0_g2_i3.p1 TRINITY_DN7783_c0_g2~~TRINITY_DN7783_c0_g2_i3.p1  ORF type:complete len:264 (+),score=55.06 TRINITY_DN7783_c0_g2_i3:885-1676(+)